MNRHPACSIKRGFQMNQSLTSLLFVAGLFLMSQLFTGCAGGYSYSYRTGPQQPYGYQGQYAQAQGFSAQGMGTCYNGVYSCPPRAVMYQPGYQGPAPQYGPYGYSAAMTARVTPQVYVMPSQPVGHMHHVGRR